MSEFSQLINRLSSSLGRRDQQPNIDLAEELALASNASQIRALVTLAEKGDGDQRHDAMKVLYEIGARAPGLIAPHAQKLMEHLTSGDNRMLWGTLQALDTVALSCPKIIAANLNLILDAADRSSVIAKDKTMSILAKLNADPRFSKTISPVILQRLTHAATNQFPKYAELAAQTMPANYHAPLVDVIATRRAQISYPAKQKRLDRLLAKLENSSCTTSK